MESKPLCPECNVAMTKRSSKFGPFWGCSQYPECRGTRRLSGNANPTSQPPQKRNQAAREAQNREVSRRLATTFYDDNQPCPFDDVPGESDIRTAFGRIGSELDVVELERVGEVDSEFAEMFR